MPEPLRSRCLVYCPLYRRTALNSEFPFVDDLADRPGVSIAESLITQIWPILETE